MNPATLILICCWSLTAAQQIMPIDKADWLEWHNKVRRQEPAADMQEMVWSDELEQMAAKWAANCQFEHSPQAERDRLNVGENLFETPNPVSAEEAFLSKRYPEFSWHYEKNHYNHATRGCAGGKMCGHYTALVWAKTCSVGCAVAKCAKLWNPPIAPIPSIGYPGKAGEWKTDWSMVVCNYGPAGNTNGRSPYTRGAKCSQCPSGSSCNNGLCSSTCSGGAALSRSGATTRTPSARTAAPARTACADLNTDCPAWATSGHCSSSEYSVYMTSNCRLSCKLCPKG